MYAARGVIQEVTGETLDDIYFTQTLLPDFQRDYPELTKNWDVTYDDRGHLTEPHTDHEIGLGTIAVREYIGSYNDDDDSADGIETPILKLGYPTTGPHHRYNTILYIEKEGFLPLLRQALFAERYDLAIMSSKGRSTTAARSLIEQMSNDGLTIFCLHDLDKSGFSILGTLTRDTRRYEYTTEPDIINLGLRLTDVQKWNLESEDVSYGESDPQWNLRKNGATAEEIEFLSKRTSDGYAGRRVELNAFTSPQFIQWLNEKLVENGAQKAIPDEAALAKAYRRLVTIRRFQQIIDDGQKEVTQYAKSLTVPKGLTRQIKKILTENPSLAWDKALELVRPASGGNR